MLKLWAGICRIFGRRCRCPRCGGEMERTPAMDESYTRVKRSTTSTINIGRGASYTYNVPHAPLKITITPVYDICMQCGHRIRRRNIRTDAG